MQSALEVYLLGSVHPGLLILLAIVRCSWVALVSVLSRPATGKVASPELAAAKELCVDAMDGGSAENSLAGFRIDLHGLLPSSTGDLYSAT